MGEYADDAIEHGFDLFFNRDEYYGDDFDEDDDYADFAPRVRRQAPSGPGKCPRCGGDMVPRTNRKKGTTFYGCKRWPSCTGTRNGPVEGSTV